MYCNQSLAVQRYTNNAIHLNNNISRSLHFRHVVFFKKRFSIRFPFRRCTVKLTKKKNHTWSGSDIDICSFVLVKNPLSRQGINGAFFVVSIYICKITWKNYFLQGWRFFFTFNHWTIIACGGRRNMTIRQWVK